MPRGSRTGTQYETSPNDASTPAARIDPPRSLELTDGLRLALRPWIDLDEVGAEGLLAWMLAILPLIPRPRPTAEPSGTDVPARGPSERVPTLALALAECASDRARAHFQASEYFRENRVLARRVKALEAMLRTKIAAGVIAPVDLRDPEAESAVHRYLPPGGP